MITASISINSIAIFTRTGVNKGVDKEGTFGKQDEIHYYLVDDGSYIEHLPIDGAVTLAKKLLNTIKEQQ